MVQNMIIPGLYQVSSIGRVKIVEHEKIFFSNGQKIVRTVKEKIRNFKPKKSGYCRVALVKNDVGKMFAVHRLVAFMFLPYPQDLLDNLEINQVQVHHINEIKHDNRVENLQWVSAKDNCNHGTRNERMKDKLTGRERTEEHSKHISEAKKGKCNGHNEPIIGIHVKTGEILKFDSLKDSISHFEKPYADRNISIAINGLKNGENRTAYGYKWYYQEDYSK